jgi:hypothetical protein
MMLVEGKNCCGELRTGKEEGDRGVGKVTEELVEGQDKRMLVEGKNSWEGNYWHREDY